MVYSSPAGIRRKRGKTVAEEDYNLLKDDVFVLCVIELGMDLPEELEESAMRKLASIRRMVISKANTMIDKYVPKDTGQLRHAMKNTIRGSYADSYRLIIFFGSQRRKTAKYMHIVNENYYKHKLAHKGKTRSHQPPYNILYDPKAKKGFIGIISKKIWEYVRTQVNIMKQRLKNEYERSGKKVSKEELYSWVRFKGQV